MPGRTFNSNSYRYGFNGMEKDDEMGIGDGNSYTTEFRQYDPRLMRWLSIDPMETQRVGLTPYNFAQNSPIAYIDWNGYGGWDDFLDAAQTTLDVAGLIPGVDHLDLVNAGVSAARGDAVGATLSLMAAVPIIGQAAGATKIAKTVIKTATKKKLQKLGLRQLQRKLLK